MTNSEEDAMQTSHVKARPRECGLFGIGIGPRKPHGKHEWTDGDGGWFACTGHAELASIPDDAK